jgi:hypothetical protein
MEGWYFNLLWQTRCSIFVFFSSPAVPNILCSCDRIKQLLALIIVFCRVIRELCTYCVYTHESQDIGRQDNRKNQLPLAEEYVT